jgi:hypothetical protein
MVNLSVKNFRCLMTDTLLLEQQKFTEEANFVRLSRWRYQYPPELPKLSSSGGLPSDGSREKL